jgi:phosphocarrier protein
MNDLVTDKLPQAARRPMSRELAIVNAGCTPARPPNSQRCEKFDAVITVSRGDETVGGSSIIGILTLGASQGATITVTATGPQAKAALDALETLVAHRFGEDE